MRTKRTLILALPDRPAGIDAQSGIFQAHLHIIDPRFPLVPSGGYLPEPFTVKYYRHRTSDLEIIGGGVVSEIGVAQGDPR